MTEKHSGSKEEPKPHVPVSAELILKQGDFIGVLPLLLLSFRIQLKFEL